MEFICPNCQGDVRGEVPECLGCRERGVLTVVQLEGECVHGHLWARPGIRVSAGERKGAVCVTCMREMGTEKGMGEGMEVQSVLGKMLAPGKEDEE